MPQLGETVTEGTVLRWCKQVGERIAVDEALLEVSTDKVDAEVPSPVAGEIVEILVAEGDTVPIGARLAVITESDGEVAAPAASGRTRASGRTHASGRTPTDPGPLARTGRGAPCPRSRAALCSGCARGHRAGSRPVQQHPQAHRREPDAVLADVGPHARRRRGRLRGRQQGAPRSRAHVPAVRHARRSSMRSPSSPA